MADTVASPNIVSIEAPADGFFARLRARTRAFFKPAAVARMPVEIPDTPEAVKAAAEKIRPPKLAPTAESALDRAKKFMRGKWKSQMAEAEMEEALKQACAPLERVLERFPSAYIPDWKVNSIIGYAHDYAKLGYPLDATFDQIVSTAIHGHVLPPLPAAKIVTAAVVPPATPAAPAAPKVVLPHSAPTIKQMAFPQLKFESAPTMKTPISPVVESAIVVGQTTALPDGTIPVKAAAGAVPPVLSKAPVTPPPVPEPKTYPKAPANAVPPVIEPPKIPVTPPPLPASAGTPSIIKPIPKPSKLADAGRSIKNLIVKYPKAGPSALAVATVASALALPNEKQKMPNADGTTQVPSQWGFGKTAVVGVGAIVTAGLIAYHATGPAKNFVSKLMQKSAPATGAIKT